MYDFSDLDDEELELIALEGGRSLAALRTRADAAAKRGDTEAAELWSDRVQAYVDNICIELGIKG